MITSFHGEFRWLSNFYPAEVKACSTIFSTVEHAYVASKSLDPTVWEIVRDLPNPGRAKLYGRTMDVRPDWDEVKIGVMRDLIHQKFQIPELRKLLIATGSTRIEEGNNWGDTFWGIDLRTGKGHNWLGNIIMEERTSILGSDGAFIY